MSFLVMSVLAALVLAFINRRNSFRWMLFILAIFAIGVWAGPNRNDPIKLALAAIIIPAISVSMWLVIRNNPNQARGTNMSDSDSSMILIVTSDFNLAEWIEKFITQLYPQVSVDKCFRDHKFSSWTTPARRPRLIVSDGTCKARDSSTQGYSYPIEFTEPRRFGRANQIPVISPVCCGLIIPVVLRFKLWLHSRRLQPKPQLTTN